MLASLVIRSAGLGFAAGKVVADVAPSTNNNLDGVIVGGVVSVIVAAFGYFTVRRSRGSTDDDELDIRVRVATVEANLESFRGEVHTDIDEVRGVVTEIRDHLRPWKDDDK
jgi:hypothetical protein